MTLEARILIILTNVILGFLQLVLFRGFAEMACKRLEETDKYVKKLSEIAADAIVDITNKIVGNRPERGEKHDKH